MRHSCWVVIPFRLLFSYDHDPNPDPRSALSGALVHDSDPDRDLDHASALASRRSLTLTFALTKARMETHLTT